MWSDFSETMLREEEMILKRVEVELAPAIWEEMDPSDLYDSGMVSLATHFENGDELDGLDGTYWWTWDFTKPPRQIRIVKS
ncbi:MAG: hypothetical protein LLG06_09345 [Desulfobacteraceae bacterium]|nr:hypothetical protein [Desulfobacteraceae bacterium]